MKNARPVPKPSATTERKHSAPVPRRHRHKARPTQAEIDSALRFLRSASRYGPERGIARPDVLVLLYWCLLATYVALEVLT